MQLLIVLCIAVAGGLAGYKLKIPVGGLLGAMVAVIIYTFIVQPSFYLPVEFRVALQLCMGPLIGSRLSREDIRGLRILALPIVILLVCMVSLNIIFGFIMYRFSNLDIATALFSTAPGGMMDMVIISADFDANYAYVALLQLSRLLVILVVIVPFYKKIMVKLRPKPEVVPGQEESKPEPEAASAALPPELRVSEKAGRFALTALCGGVLGIVLWLLGVPAGAIIGSMLGAGAFNIITSKGYCPPKLRLPLQIVSGAFIGLRMDRESLLGMAEIIVPLIFLFIAVIAMTFVTAFVVHKLTGLDLATCLIASTPGGIGEMSLLADDLKIDVPKVVVIHTARLMSVIILFPGILAFVLWLL